MKILAIETATQRCGVAAWCAETGRMAVRQQQVTTHSEMLLPLVAECLTELGWRPLELSAVACGAGPGSFTGLRIGLATAKGLCFALGLPLVLVSALSALAARALSKKSQQPVLATLDAFRGQVFARLEVPPAGRTSAIEAVLASHPQLADDAVWQPQALADAVAKLDCWLVGRPGPYGQRLWDDDPAPHPLDVARIGAARLLAGERAPLHSAVPNYLCASAAEEMARTSDARLDRARL